MPIADRTSATAPNSASSTIGVRRFSSDRDHPLLHRPHVGDRLFGIDALHRRAHLRDERLRIEAGLEHERHAGAACACCVTG